MELWENEELYFNHRRELNQSWGDTDDEGTILEILLKIGIISISNW